MRFETDDVLFRPVVWEDEDHIYEMCKDWTHDGIRFTRYRAQKAIEEYMNDWANDVHEYPATADSLYQETLIGFDAKKPDEPMVLFRYIVRGANHYSNDTGVNLLHTSLFIIAPKYRGQGRMKKIVTTLNKWGFENMGVELSTQDWIDSPQNRSQIADRYTKHPTREHTSKKGTKLISAKFTKADHEEREAANQSERNLKVDFFLD